MTPEARARQTIDSLLVAAGWHVCGIKDANIHATVGVAIREFPLNPGFGFADYLLYVNGKACGVIEAKKEGATLSGVEAQSGRYAQGLPTSLPAWQRPLPFLWESTGVETHFTNRLDPQPRARSVFAFFRPELLVQWLAYAPLPAAPGPPPAANEEAGTFLAQMRPVRHKSSECNIRSSWTPLACRQATGPRPRTSRCLPDRRPATAPSGNSPLRRPTASWCGVRDFSTGTPTPWWDARAGTSGCPKPDSSTKQAAAWSWDFGQVAAIWPLSCWEQAPRQRANKI